MQWDDILERETVPPRGEHNICQVEYAEIFNQANPAHVPYGGCMKNITSQSRKPERMIISITTILKLIQVQIYCIKNFVKIQWFKHQMIQKISYKAWKAIEEEKQLESKITKKPKNNWIQTSSTRTMNLIKLFNWVVNLKNTRQDVNSK